jgi:cation:H+ antiporter
MGLLPQAAFSFFLFFFFLASELKPASAYTLLWAAPAILASSLLIAWAAESAQYFVAQGFALAILAWLQTLPEFATEAVLAWHQKTDLLLAGLTGALRLLTGLGWPLIYLTAAVFHRRRTGKPLLRIELEGHHAVEVLGLIAALIYIPVIALKGTLSVWDGAILLAVYIVYLIILSRLPAEDHETIDDLETVPRAIVTAKRRTRILAITVLFLLGGALIYVGAEPFLAGLLGFAVTMGMSEFVFVQWIAPIVSEFPEMMSTLGWARRPGLGSMSLMNMVSSNINQWTMLTAMLPIVYSVAVGTPTAIVFDAKQVGELWLTLAQAFIGVIFLVNMELSWFEALVLGVLFAIPFADERLKQPVTYLYFAWAVFEIVLLIMGKRTAKAFPLFAKVWREHVRGVM